MDNGVCSSEWDGISVCYVFCLSLRFVLEMMVLAVGVIAASRVRVVFGLMKCDRDHALIANQQKSDFISFMCHELRNPLHAILATSEQLSTVSSAERDDGIKVIIEAAANMRTIVNDVLDLGKMEAFKLDLEVIPFDIRSVVQSVLKTYGPLADAKGLSFTTAIDVSCSGTMFGDPHRFRQVLTNLVSNALKFTDTGEIRVSMRVYCGTLCAVNSTNDSHKPSLPNLARVIPDSRTCTLEFSVADTGSGIASENLNKLFQSYSQAQLSTAREHGGSGLGLSIVSRLIRLMGGEITVNSTLGKGTTFTCRVFLFCTRSIPSTAAIRTKSPSPFFDIPTEFMSPIARPLVLVHDAAMITPVDVTPVLPIRRKGVPLPRVLVADDQLVNRRIEQRILRNYYSVDCAENGQQALDMVHGKQKEYYAALLLDEQMPVMGGIEVTRILRKEGYQFPILAVSANALSHSRSMYLAEGMDGSVSKPFGSRDLLKALAHVLSSRSHHNPLRCGD
jgi:signal transduction histidine kinase/ActR/RegA family two-component response regulator